MRIWQGSFTDSDFCKLQHIRISHGQDSMAEALRFSIERQMERDSPENTPDKKLLNLYDEAADECIQMSGRWQRANSKPGSSEEAAQANADREKLKKWTCQLTGDQHYALILISRKYSLKKKAAAARFVVYVQAALENYKSDQLGLVRR